MKWIYTLFKIPHVHCFCDKRGEFVAYGVKMIVMCCNKCGLEKTITEVVEGKRSE